MTPERWQRIKPLLQSALEREPADRSAFLAVECAGDEALRKDVESFIASHDQLGGFIESPAFELMAGSLVDDQVVGRTLGPYAISARLGAGGMGEVYLAQDIRLKRKVALKMLPAYLTIEDERVRRFQQEARAASALNHPNIITIYEIREMDSRHFMATEFIEGETLFERLNAGPMKISDALEVAVQVTAALCAAHQAGIVHRDIKPGNIMLRTDGIVKVLDFGLATLTDQKGDDLEAATLVKTKPGIIMGSAHYMSPEQARGLIMDARTDIFSLGVVLYQMVTGRAPFAGQTMTDVLASILMLEPPSLSQSVPDAPEQLHRIVHKALRKDKEERYQTAGELLTDLKTLKQRLEFEVELERSNVGRKATSSRRTRRSAKSKAIYSVAVLPLVNASADPNMDYFSDGVTESIINALSQLPKLRVVARGTAFRYKGREIDPQEAGQELGVRAVLSGRVRQVGDDLMIAAELIDVTNDTHLWGEHYSRKLSDIFAVQEEIAKEISDKLRIKLTPAERKRLTKRSTDSTEAYQLYLKGRYFWNKRTEEGLRKSIEYFQQTIEKDPAYAAAYAGISDCHTILVVRHGMSSAEGLRRAKASAMKAMEIDDTLAEAHSALAHAMLHNWEWAESEREFRRALSLNPDDATAHNFLAEYLLAVGQIEEAIVEIKKAQESDPLSLIINSLAGWAFYFARQYDQAIEECQKALEIDANFSWARYRLGQAYERKGMFAEAIAELRQAKELSQGNKEMLAALGHAYATSGGRKDAQNILDELHEESNRGSSLYDIALIYAGLGENDEAFQWLEKAYQEHDGKIVHLNVEPRLDGLRSDSRFTDLVRRMGLQRPMEVEPELDPVMSEPSGPNSSSIPIEQNIRFCTTSDGVRIAYATVGAGPPLVKAANWLNHLEFDWKSPIWRHLLEEFGRDHLLVRYDERGNGLSDWNVENFTFEAFVQDLATVVDSLGLDRFPILGISQGGPVAIAYAVRHPERVSHLILYGSYARGWAKRDVPEDIERRQAQNMLIKFGWGQDNPAFRQLWTTQYVPDGTPEQWKWFNDLHRICTSPDNAVRLEHELGQIDVVDLLSRVKVPTLVLHCRDEVAVPFEEGRLLAAKIPGARFVPLEGRNHLLLESEPAWPKFVNEVRRFLESEQFETKPEWSTSTDLNDTRTSGRHTAVATASGKALLTGEIAAAASASSEPTNPSSERYETEQRAELPTHYQRSRPRWTSQQAAIVVGLGLIAALIAGYLLSQSNPGTKDIVAPRTPSFTQLTYQPGAEFFPSLSPDGKSLAYASRSLGNWDIYVQRVGGTNPLNLTDDSPADDSQPAFSPDGERIAFRSERHGGGIYLMGATGESITRVSDFGYSPSWSPDGAQLLVGTEKIPQPSTRPTKSQLWKIDIKSGQRRLISEGDALQSQYSPNKQRIAYWSRPSKAGQREDIWTIPAEGGEAVRITSGSTIDVNPVWSPDGRYLYFSSSRGGSMNVWRVPVDEESGATAGEPEAVTTIGAATSALQLSFSRDGRRLAYIAQEDIRNLRKVAFDPATGKAAGEPQWITRGSMQLWFPDPSPDGEWLAACSRGQQRHVYIIRTDGTDLRDLTEDNFRNDGWPRWSPDGRRIAFTSRRTGDYEVWVINRDGSGLRQVTESKGGHYSPWSPDGKTIAYSIHAPKNDCALVQPDKPWGAQQLTYLPALSDANISFEGWAWSTDGKRLAGIKHLPNGLHSGIGVYDPASGNYDWFTDFGDWPVWLKDNRRMLFVSQGKIFLFDTASRKDELVLTVTDQDVDIGSPSLSPDNKTLYFTFVSAEADIWLMTLD